MAPRAYWKGYLKLSLVSCPVALYPAISASERISFHRINKETGNRLKQQMVEPQQRVEAVADSTVEPEYDVVNSGNKQASDRSKQQTVG